MQRERLLCARTAPPRTVLGHSVSFLAYLRVSALVRSSALRGAPYILRCYGSFARSSICCCGCELGEAHCLSYCRFRRLQHALFDPSQSRRKVCVGYGEKGMGQYTTHCPT